jgi:hypothetical protein
MKVWIADLASPDGLVEVEDDGRISLKEFANDALFGMR